MFIITKHLKTTQQIPSREPICKTEMRKMAGMSHSKVSITKRQHFFKVASIERVHNEGKINTKKDGVESFNEVVVILFSADEMKALVRSFTIKRVNVSTTDCALTTIYPLVC